MRLLNREYDPEDISIAISELLVATADGADASIDAAVTQVLSALRQSLQMDVVFVAEFVNGERVFRHVDRSADAPAIEVGDAGPLEESYCQRVVDGRLPESVADIGALPASFKLPPQPLRVGAHLSTAVRLADGSVYGTLCCFSSGPNLNLQQRDLDNLRNCAVLVARRLDAARLARGESGPLAVVEWQLTQPMADL